MKEPMQIEPKVKPYTAQDFHKEYEALCEKMGFQIVVNPTFVSTNHNSYEVALQVSIGATPKK